MIRRAEVARLAREANVRFDIVEHDYCIGWMLFGLSRTRLVNGLVFKGGTAIRKCYFPDYRFSADLDFTCLADAIPSDRLQPLLDEACRIATDASGVEYSLERFEQRRDVTGKEAHVAKVIYRGPSQRRPPLPKIELDLTYYEQVVLGAARLPIRHPYSDGFDTEILAYRLEEILAEKLRAILQQKLRVPRPRDYYDLWELLVRRQLGLDKPGLLRAFGAKCRYKAVQFTSPEDFFAPDLIEKNRGAWQTSIGRQVGRVEGFDGVITELRAALGELFGEERCGNGDVVI